MSENDLQNGKNASQRARSYVAKELRQMANGFGDYNCFAGVSPWIKNIWHAAADLLEEEEGTDP